MTMLQIIYGHEGNTEERGLYRRIKEYEFTCDSCGADMSLEDSVYEFGKGYCCERCLKEEFKVGDVEAIIDKECGG